jgi:hypothetical protein
MAEQQPILSNTEKKKKRRWDIPDPTIASTQTSLTVPAATSPTTPTSPPSVISPSSQSTISVPSGLSSTLSQIAAKLTPPPPVPVSDPTQAAQIAASKITQLLAAKGVTPKKQIFTAEIEINHCRPDIRYYLTKGTTHEEIFKETGATISSKGRYKPPGDTSDERALYLLVSADKKEAVDKAEAKIREIMSRGIERPQITAKVFVGLDNAESAFGLIPRLLGKQGANVKYIATESNVKITLKGPGTEYETSGEDEPLHFYIVATAQKNLDTAKSLVENLINHTKQEYDKWKQTTQTLSPSQAATSSPASTPLSPPYPYPYPPFIPPNYPPSATVPPYPPYGYPLTPPPLYSSPPSAMPYPGGYSPPPPSSPPGYYSVLRPGGQPTETDSQNQPLYPAHFSPESQRTEASSEGSKPKRRFQEFVNKEPDSSEPPIGPKRPTPEEMASAVLPEVTDSESDAPQRKEEADDRFLMPPPLPPKGLTGKKRTSTSEEKSADSKRPKTETGVKLVDYDGTDEEDSDKRKDYHQPGKEAKRPFWAAPPLDPTPPLAVYSGLTTPGDTNKASEGYGKYSTRQHCACPLVFVHTIAL